MNPRRIVSLSLLSCATLVSCQTNVAMFDRDFGYERELAGRAVRVHASRAQIEPGRPPEASDVVVVIPGGTVDGPGVRYHKLTLRLKLHNETGEPWEFGRDNIRFSFTDSTTDECEDCAPATGPSWITVPANSIGSVNIPITLVLPKDVDMSDAERFWLDVKVHGTEGGEPVMHRRLVLGSYNQIWQILRFGTVLTAMLVITAV